METLTIDEISQKLQNQNDEKLTCLSVIFIPYINNITFAENASLLRNLSGLSLRQAAMEIENDISRQALYQFEKNRYFPEDKAKELLQLYLFKAIDYALEGNKLLLNVIFSLFFLTTIHFPLTPEIIKRKKTAFENLKKHIDDETYKEKYTEELNTLFNDLKEQKKLLPLISENKAFYNYFSANISIETKPVLTALTKNLKSIRFLLDNDQKEMSKLLKIKQNTYIFYESNLHNYTLNIQVASKIIEELFNHFENKENKSLQKIIKFLFIQKNEKDNKIITETLYDYFIAIKYKQSQGTIEYLENKLTNIKLAKIFNYPIVRETEHVDSNDLEESIFN